MKQGSFQETREFPGKRGVSRKKGSFQETGEFQGIWRGSEAITRFPEKRGVT